MTGSVLSEQLWWYVARSGGIVALALTGLSIVWGLVASTRAMQGAVPPKWTLAMHRWLAGLSVTFTAIHMAALVLDNYVHFAARELFVPFASEWKPGAVAWGVVAMYLLAAVQLSSLLMRRLPRKLWRTIHVASWFVFFTGLVHGATAGTDSDRPLYVISIGALTLVILWLTLTRVLLTRRAASAPTTQTTARVDATAFTRAVG